MRNLKPVLYVLCCLVLCIATFAQAGQKSIQSAPRDYLPGSDRSLVQLTNPVDGTLWSVWSYSNGAEFDLAISATAVEGNTTELLLIGEADHFDQSEPALTVDANGTLYLAYTEQVGRAGKRLVVSALPFGGTTWTFPVTMSGPARGLGSPALAVVSDRVVLAFQVRDGIEILDLPPLQLSYDMNFTDDPDPVSNYWPEPDADEDEEYRTHGNIADGEVQNTIFGPGQSSGSGNGTED